MRKVRTSRTPVRPYSPVAFSLIWGTYNTVKSLYTGPKGSESLNYLLKVFFALSVYGYIEENLDSASKLSNTTS